MRLTGKVITIESGDQFTDKQQRVTVKITEAGSCLHSKLELPNLDGWQLDDEVIFNTVATVSKVHFEGAGSPLSEDLR